MRVKKTLMSICPMAMPPFG